MLQSSLLWALTSVIERIALHEQILLESRMHESYLHWHSQSRDALGHENVALPEAFDATTAKALPPEVAPLHSRETAPLQSREGEKPSAHNIWSEEEEISCRFWLIASCGKTRKAQNLSILWLVIPTHMLILPIYIFTYVSRALLHVVILLSFCSTHKAPSNCSPTLNSILINVPICINKDRLSVYPSVPSCPSRLSRPSVLPSVRLSARPPTSVRVVPPHTFIHMCL